MEVLVTVMPRFAKMMTEVNAPLPPRNLCRRVSRCLASTRRPITRTVDDLLERPQKVVATGVNFFYGEHQALHGVTLSFPQNCVTALIGPSGCGKSTFLRCLNRMNDMIEGTRIEGEILLDDEDIYRHRTDVVATPQARGHGLSKVQSLPEIDLRQRRLRPARGRRPQAGGPRRNRRKIAPSIGPVGRSLGPAR